VSLLVFMAFTAVKSLSGYFYLATAIYAYIGGGVTVLFVGVYSYIVDISG